MKTVTRASEQTPMAKFGRVAGSIMGGLEDNPPAAKSLVFFSFLIGWEGWEGFVSLKPRVGVFSYLRETGLSL